MTQDPSKMTTYADAGVDMDAGNALVSAIKPVVAATKRPGVVGSIGGFGGLFDLKEAGYGEDTLLVAATDGVGTKLKLAQIADQHHSIGIDLVAMCVNDLLAQGAEPLFFLDYYACGSLSVPLASEVVSGIAAGCQQAGCALIGGETAEMPGMYEGKAYDLAGFAIGAVPRTRTLPRKDEMKPGDVLLGLPSSGIHSNGFSLVRRLIKYNNLAYDAAAPWNPSLSVADSLLLPTRIYVAACLPLLREESRVKGFAHITGGGLSENIPRVLPDHLMAEIDLSSWALPGVFSWMKDAAHMDDTEMLRTFNCGIGAVLVVDADAASDVITGISKTNEAAVVELGRLAERETPETAIRYSGEL